MKKLVRAAALFGAASLMFAGTPVAASANSAPAYWSGSSSAGVYLTENCPVAVERENLTIQVGSLPKSSYDTIEELKDYHSSVTAEYHLRNLADEDVKVGLMFPLGTRPSYFSSDMGALDDLSSYQIEADGEEIGKSLRYSYLGGGGEYVLPEKGEVPDVPVFVHSVKADAAEAVIAATLSYDPRKTAVAVAADGIDNYFYRDGDLVLLFGGTGTFRVLGEDAAPSLRLLKKKGYDAGISDGKEEELEGTVSHETETYTFADFAGVERTASALEYIGEEDFCGIFAAALKDGEYTASGGCGLLPYGAVDVGRIVRWYEYTLEIPASGETVNRVTAPLYPDITGGRYDYTYLLSPARGFASFGELDLCIETSYALTEFSLNLEKTETGYEYHRTGLPLCELSFSVGEYTYSPLYGCPVFGCALTSAGGGAAVSLAALLGVACVLLFRKKDS